MEQNTLSSSDLRLAILATVYMGRKSIFFRPAEQGLVVEQDALEISNQDCPPAVLPDEAGRRPAFRAGATPRP